MFNIDRDKRGPSEVASHDRASSDTPSHALLLAAISGLLCVGGAACNDDNTDGGEDAAGEDATGPEVTSSKVVEGGLTLAAFTEQCDTLRGAVEVHASCAGVNSCRGMSYDSVTLVLTEHTCRGLNSCSGFSCVLPDGSTE